MESTQPKIFSYQELTSSITDQLAIKKNITSDLEFVSHVFFFLCVWKNMVIFVTVLSIKRNTNYFCL